MGDRGNISFHESPDTPPIYMYSHWGGSGLHEVVANALARGVSRWGDSSYLARIIFCELIKDDVDGTTGYGLQVVPQGDARDVVRVYDYGGGKVEYGGEAYSYQQFVDTFSPQEVHGEG